MLGACTALGTFSRHVANQKALCRCLAGWNAKLRRVGSPIGKEKKKVHSIDRVGWHPCMWFWPKVTYYSPVASGNTGHKAA